MRRDLPATSLIFSLPGIITRSWSASMAPFSLVRPLGYKAQVASSLLLIVARSEVRFSLRGSSAERPPSNAARSKSETSHRADTWPMRIGRESSGSGMSRFSTTESDSAGRRRFRSTGRRSTGHVWTTGAEGGDAQPAVESAKRTPRVRGRPFARHVISLLLYKACLAGERARGY